MNSSTNAVKRWWYIMPIVFITYSLAYLDRANFSFASAAGINEDLGITKGVSSLLGALFFLGYFFFQIPGAIYAERRSVRKLIFICLILWGACASLTGVDNDATLLNLGKQAVVAAAAGADFIAPSAAMDGQVQAIRQALDAAGFTDTAIMSYSTKFASSFYGPFREAAGTALKGDRKTYQMNPLNRREAIRESLLDEAQGADCLMVKPAGAYLDILRDIRERTELPLGAYQVSGEYAMIKFAAQAGAIDEEKVILESLGAIKRAGADLIFSYFALDLAEKKILR